MHIVLEPAQAAEGGREGWPAEQHPCACRSTRLGQGWTNTMHLCTITSNAMLACESPSEFQTPEHRSAPALHCSTTGLLTFPFCPHFLTGGGHNHRMGLYDMMMIKDNHVTAAGGVTAAVAAAEKYITEQELGSMQVRSAARMYLCGTGRQATQPLEHGHLARLAHAMPA